MTNIEKRIAEYRNLIHEKIEEQSRIKEEHPYMHWSSELYKKCQQLNSEVLDLHGKIQCLIDNEDEAEVNSVLNRNEWSWVSK